MPVKHPYHEVERGDHGTVVRILQCHLRRVTGKKIVVDGDFGEHTDHVLRAWQRKQKNHELRTYKGKTRCGHTTWQILTHAKTRRGFPSHKLAIRALIHALNLVGVMEEGGNNTGPIVSKIIRAAGGLVGEAWCGDFNIFTFLLAGSKRITRSAAAVRLLGPLSGMRRIRKPYPGCVVQYTFDHEGKFIRHLGGGMIETCEGNTGASGAVSDSTTGGDGVYIKQRPESEVRAYFSVLG